MWANEVLKSIIWWFEQLLCTHDMTCYSCYMTQVWMEKMTMISPSYCDGPACWSVDSINCIWCILATDLYYCRHTKILVIGLDHWQTLSMSQLLCEWQKTGMDEGSLCDLLLSAASTSSQSTCQIVKQGYVSALHYKQRHITNHTKEPMETCLCFGSP